MLRNKRAAGTRAEWIEEFLCGSILGPYVGHEVGRKVRHGGGGDNTYKQYYFNMEDRFASS
jgi:hypothetical protein